MSVYRVTSQKSEDLKYSGTSNNKHSQGISVLSVVGGRGVHYLHSYLHGEDHLDQSCEK
jgi:hypothetical protein